MSKKIAKSPEILLKEAKIKDLQAHLKKRQTTLKSLKTRLKNMQSDISEISRKSQTQILDKMLKVDTLRKELVALTKELKKVKGISREDKEQLTIMANELAGEDVFGENQEDLNDYRERMENPEYNFDEDYRAKMRDMFQHFRVPIEEKEQKDIRKVFIKLSQSFHPDRAKNEKEEKEFHQMMLQINEAYQIGDIQTLLELERLYLVNNLDLNEVKALTVDVLQKEIDRLDREIEFIDNQVTRTSKEISNLRNSELGGLLTDVKKAERSGEGGLDEMSDGLDQMIAMFEKLKEGFEDSIKRGEISPILNDMVMTGFDGMFQEGMDIFDELGGDEFDEEDIASLMDMLSDGFFGGNDEYDRAIKNLKFKIGSSVKVVKPVKSEVMPGVKMKGWEGRVINAYAGVGGKEIYEVEFDSITLNQIPVKNLKEAIEELVDFSEHEFMVNELEKSKPRDKKKDTITTYRTLLHKYCWSELDDKKQAERLQKIMMSKPEKMDLENWDDYLEKSLKFPFKVETKGIIFNGVPMGQTLTVERLLGKNEDFGHLVGCEFKGQRISYPLIDLMAEDESGKNYEILDDYSEWGDYFLDI